MARVTVEDCLKYVDNRFDLVIKAAERAHMLELGAADPTVPVDNDKPTVLALREIAAGHDITKRRVSTGAEAEVEAETETKAKAEESGAAMSTVSKEISISSTEQAPPQKPEDSGQATEKD